MLMLGVCGFFGRNRIAAAGEMRDRTRIILLAQKDILLYKREMQQGGNQPRCTASEHRAGNHTFGH